MIDRGKVNMYFRHLLGTGTGGEKLMLKPISEHLAQEPIPKVNSQVFIKESS